MMRTARHAHACRTEQECEARQMAHLAAWAARTGDPLVERETVSAPVAPRINDGGWLFDCECGNGVACDPSWSRAFCFACGKVYTAFEYPDDRLDIEFVLKSRRRVNQHWLPGETLLDLALENAEHGVGF